MRYKLYLQIALLLLAAGQPSFGKRIIVDNSSIIKAVAKASPGDTIYVTKGLYKESNIIIDKPLSLIAEEGAVIDGQFHGHIVNIQSDSVTVKGFTLKNVKQSYTKEYAAIHTYKSSHFIIENNTLRKAYFGILIENSKFGIIRNNNIIGEAVREENSGNGIHCWHSARLQIYNNHIERMRDGIYFEFVKHSEITGNVSMNNVRYGLHFMFSNNDRYVGNTFENNGAGVAVMFSNRIAMLNNTFRLNWGSASYGLLLKEIYDAEIKENIFYKNTIGVNADGANRINFRNNTFDNNGWAIRFLGACYGNRIINNNFMHNALDISYKGNMNGNIFDKNYWSEYTGYDLNKDNIGDVPYRPVKLFSYVVNKTPETIILLRSLFVDIINFSEKVSPIMTPDNLKDNRPLMNPIENNDRS
ncbi:MAG TPA: nitrous oxide reductase family maturation protein NosD [Caldithrix abyssi]|uniref:Nitrous oxide reductase family maturation protein NosD n=1 Tax=Caldithrix abyssi TaxID=187145 RepID=A0A7V4U1W2_CALAY|nr:nitrous oxide reductase family maturation protein NosD [Caldithrix abyssi]